MEYEFDTKAFGRLLDDKRLNKNRVRAAFGMTNDVTIRRWAEGHDIYASKLVEFCNKFDCNLLEFFLKDGTPMAELVESDIKKETACIAPSQNEDLQKRFERNEKLLTYYEKEITEKDLEIVRLKKLLKEI